MDRRDIAVTWAVATANDDSHGYDQNNRWGSSFDCSSLVITAYEQAGVPIRKAGGTYTGDMRKAFTACGFSQIPYKRGMQLEFGDVLLNESHHTALYIGNGKIVHASINEKGTITGGAPGDQTGKEICVRQFYDPSYGWQWVLRIGGGNDKVSVLLTECKKGSKCTEVGVIQVLLNKLGYKDEKGNALQVDQDLGSHTDHAIRAFQRDTGLVVDGVVGTKSWTKLLTAVNYIP